MDFKPKAIGSLEPIVHNKLVGNSQKLSSLFHYHICRVDFGLPHRFSKLLCYPSKMIYAK